jgi:hypothetical protein
MNEVLFFTYLDYFCYMNCVKIKIDLNRKGWWRNGSAL